MSILHQRLASEFADLVRAIHASRRASIGEQSPSSDVRIGPCGASRVLPGALEARDFTPPLRLGRLNRVEAT